MNERDPRYQRADEAIRNAFLELFKEKDIQAISASEVIRASGVNRSTFYAHYADKYELLDSIEGDFLAQLEAILGHSPIVGLLVGKRTDEGDLESYFAHLIDYLNENRSLLAGLVASDDGAFLVDFGKALADVLAQTGAEENLRMPVNYATAAFAWAVSGMVREWVRGGFADSKEDIVRIQAEFARGIQRAVLG